ncbi:MAG: hypothetical protein ACYC91_15705 [Solirubrobacteraceae bacterium]
MDACTWGAGDAMTFIGVLRLIAAWLPAQRAPLLTQLTGVLGQVDQITAADPLVALLPSVGWGISVSRHRRAPHAG